MQRTLREDKLVETAERLGQRIADRFPCSGLSQVGQEIVQIIREAMARAERIRRPDVRLRAGLGLVLGLALLALGLTWVQQSPEERQSALTRVQGVFDVTKGLTVYLGAGAVFLITLEVRLKRWRALRAIHELRAMAHLI